MEQMDGNHSMKVEMKIYFLTNTLMA